MDYGMQQMSQKKHMYVTVPCDREERAYEDFVSTLADEIIEQYEKPLLGKILFNTTEEVSPYQIREMLLQLPEISGDAEVGIAKRHHAVMCDLKHYFSEYSSASIAGLVLFRLKDYKALLEQTAECLIDLHLAKKEYEEFVSLLRYFVSVQSARPCVTNLLVYPHGRYALLNEEGTDITALCMAEFVPTGETVAENMDDLLISILITLAPERLIIHGREHITNFELFATVEKVFDKTDYCDSCTFCKKIKSDA